MQSIYLLMLLVVLVFFLLLQVKYLLSKMSIFTSNYKSQYTVYAMDNT